MTTKTGQSLNYSIIMAYPKTVGIFWAGLSIYTAFVDKEIRDKLPDLPNKLLWWRSISHRMSRTVLILVASCAVLGVLSFRQTKNKLFIYGTVAALPAIPLSYGLLGTNQNYLKNKTKHVRDGSLLTKSQEKGVEENLTIWDSRLKIRTLIPIAVSILFGIAQYQQLTRSK